MADYIKREDAISQIESLASQYYKSKLVYNMTICAGINTALREVQRVPTADVRPVVTCAECRYYSEKRRECGHINGLSEIVFPTDYCVYGSRPMMDGEG